MMNSFRLSQGLSGGCAHKINYACSHPGSGFHPRARLSSARVKVSWSALIALRTVFLKFAGLVSIGVSSSARFFLRRWRSLYECAALQSTHLQPRIYDVSVPVHLIVNSSPRAFGLWNLPLQQVRTYHALRK